MFWGFGRSENGPEERFRCDGGSVGDGDLAPGGVVDLEGVEILNQRATAPYIEDLDAEADGEDRLIEVVRVLEEKLIDVFARVVGGRALGDGVLTILLRVHIGGAAGEEDCLAGVDQVGDLDGCGEEGNFDGFATAAFNARGVLRPGALIVVRIG